MDKHLKRLKKCVFLWSFNILIQFKNSDGMATLSIIVLSGQNKRSYRKRKHDDMTSLFYKLVYYLHNYNTPQFNLTTPVSRDEVKVNGCFLKAFIKELSEQKGCVADTKRYKCVCGHRIKCIFVIQHRVTNELYLIGRDCIKKMFPSMTNVIDELKKECTKFNEYEKYVKRTMTYITDETNMYIDLFFSFVKRGMRDMNQIKERIDKIRERVQEKNNERERFKRPRNIKHYYFDVLHDNAVPRIMLIIIIKKTNTNKVQSKFETWKYNVCRLKEQEQVHKLK